jgi:hypothetical protein
LGDDVYEVGLVVVVDGGPLLEKEFLLHTVCESKIEVVGS